MALFPLTEAARSAQVFLMDAGSAAEQLQLLVETTRALGEATDVQSALAITLERFGTSTRWAFGAGWVPDASDGMLHCIADWMAPGRALADFAAATRETVFATGVGLPGRVWESGQWAWILDVTHDANFPRLQLAGRAGLRTGVAMPILAGDSLVAVIEFFLTEPRLADAPMIELVAAVASQLGSVVERIQVEQAQRVQLEQLQRLHEELEAREARSRALVASVGEDLLGRLGSPGEAGEALRLVEDLVACTRTVPLDARCALPGLVAGVIVGLGAGARVQSQLPDDLPAVRGDADGLRRVFRHLLETASGEVRVTARREGPLVEVSVAEGGAGKAGARRSGSGLLIVASLLERHGGSLRVQDEHERGAGCTLRLPAAPED